MYCKNCGRFVYESSTRCENCGTSINTTSKTNNDHSSFGFAILGFFIPLLGLIFFLVYEKEKPKRAKSAGKGALIGFITKIFITLILTVIYTIFTFSMFDTILDKPIFHSPFTEESSDDILENYVDVTFGEFKISDNKYYSDTSLEVTVKNKAENRQTYYITVEALDSNGARLDTDIIYADKLNSGQKIHLTAFEYVEQEKLEQFKNAKFKVLEIKKYDT